LPLWSFKNSLKLGVGSSFEGRAGAARALPAAHAAWHKTAAYRYRLSKATMQAMRAPLLPTSRTNNNLSDSFVVQAPKECRRSATTTTKRMKPAGMTIGGTIHRAITGPPRKQNLCRYARRTWIALSKINLDLGNVLIQINDQPGWHDRI
jgi:hypothetical protein